MKRIVSLVALPSLALCLQASAGIARAQVPPVREPPPPPSCRVEAIAPGTLASRTYPEACAKYHTGLSPSNGGKCVQNTGCLSGLCVGNHHSQGQCAPYEVKQYQSCLTAMRPADATNLEIWTNVAVEFAVTGKAYFTCLPLMSNMVKGNGELGSACTMQEHCKDYCAKQHAEAPGVCVGTPTSYPDGKCPAGYHLRLTDGKDRVGLCMPPL